MKAPKKPRKPKASGYQNRVKARERERESLRARAAELGLDVRDPAEPEQVDEAAAAEARFIAAVNALGPMPTDPVDTIVRGNLLTAIVMHSAAVDPPSPTLTARRRAVLDAVRALGMTNSKAIDKARLLRIEQRLGLAEKEVDRGLEECVDGDSALRA